MEYAAFSWKKGAHVKADPEEVFGIFEQIRVENDGDLPTDAIVDKARDMEGHALHDEFVWDVEAAARMQWNGRAAELRRFLCVVRKGAEGLGPTRVYEVVDTPANGGPARRLCMTLEDILNDPIARAELLEQAMREAERFKRRFGQLSELTRVIAAIEEIAA